MKIFPFVLTAIAFAALTFFATTARSEPVTVMLSHPVEVKPGVFVNRVDVNYIYVDSEHLDIYTSIGSVRACYPALEIPLDSASRSEFLSMRAAECAIEFSYLEIMEPAFEFIKITVPNSVKTWAESLGKTP